MFGKFHEVLPKLPGELLSFCGAGKENTVSAGLHVGHSCLTHSFVSGGEEAPVYAACSAVITVGRVLIECADLLEIGRRWFEERALYSLIRSMVPEMFFFYFLREIGVFYKV